jgi:hypothetical protein
MFTTSIRCPELSPPSSTPWIVSQNGNAMSRAWGRGLGPLARPLGEPQPRQARANPRPYEARRREGGLFFTASPIHRGSSRSPTRSMRRSWRGWETRSCRSISRWTTNATSRAILSIRTSFASGSRSYSPSRERTTHSFLLRAPRRSGEIFPLHASSFCIPVTLRSKKRATDRL